MCPDFPRVTATVDPAVIWNYSTRTLTSLTGQPRIDLLGVDLNLASIGYTSERAAKLDNLDHLTRIPAFDDPIEGTVVMDGTEKNVILDEVEGNPQRYLEGYIDLSPMASGDTIVIRQYMKIAPDGDYRKYAEETYSGAQEPPLLYITTKPGRYGIKITAQQTAGSYRTLTYQFFRRRVK